MKRFQTIKQFKGEGVLYFFGTICHILEVPRFKDILVCYLEQTNDFTTIDLPADIEKYGVFTETDLLIKEEINIPQWNTPLWIGAKMSSEEFESYIDIKNLINHYNYNTYQPYYALMTNCLNLIIWIHILNIQK